MLDRSIWRSARPLAVLTLAALAACGGGGGSEGGANLGDALKVAGGIPANARGECSVKMAENALKPDRLASVLVVKAFAQGEPLLLSGAPTAQTPRASNDLCFVKLLVGPGNTGPAGAPSTSPGIGIEVWMPTPSNWIGRLHNLGGGGWAGGRHADSSVIASTAGATVAGNEGAISGTTDTGHAIGSGSFAMNPDGTINTALWTDFAERSLHELAVKTKNLSAAYYGRLPTYSYWEGGSTGGRQGLKIAQEHPADYDGLIVNYPAINWTKFITSELYPQIVYQRDLGGTALTTAQANAVGNAAIGSCDVVGGQHLGYILDPSTCTYDPTKDAAVLCAGVQGNDGVTGTNATASCVNLAQATAVNKIWYGQTTDGSVPDPAADTGWPLTPSGKQRWFGLARGTSFGGLAGSNPFTIATDMVALEMQDAALATPSFVNATGTGTNGWRAYTYAQLSNAWDRGVQLQPQFGRINTDNADLSAFARRGGRMLTWHGLADTLIHAGGTINYYNRVAAQTGSLAAVQDFWRLYLVPGAGHGAANGTTNAAANPPAWAPGQQYALLTAWVEQGVAPDQVTLQTPASSPIVKSRPVCVYPKQATHIGGDPNVATSYGCS